MRLTKTHPVAEHYFARHEKVGARTKRTTFSQKGGVGREKRWTDVHRKGLVSKEASACEKYTSIIADRQSPPRVCALRGEIRERDKGGGALGAGMGLTAKKTKNFLP